LRNIAVDELVPFGGPLACEPRHCPQDFN
jgi:hypothetical protein